MVLNITTTSASEDSCLWNHQWCLVCMFVSLCHTYNAQTCRLNLIYFILLLYKWFIYFSHGDSGFMMRKLIRTPTQYFSKQSYLDEVKYIQEFQEIKKLWCGKLYSPPYSNAFRIVISAWVKTCQLSYFPGYSPTSRHHDLKFEHFIEQYRGCWEKLRRTFILIKATFQLCP